MSQACLTKHAKLLKAADYNHVFDKPARSADRYFTVLARPNQLLTARLGMAFSKKRVKLSVARNRFIEDKFFNSAWGLPAYFVAQLILTSTAIG